MIHIYLITLLIAPQLWLQPFVGWPVDAVILPVWLVVAFATGAITKPGWSTFDTLFSLFIVQIVLSGAINGTVIEHLPQTLFYFRFFLLYRLASGSITGLTSLNRVMLSFSIMALLLGVESIQHKFSATGLGWAGQTLGWIDPEVLKAGGNGRTRWVGIWDGPGVFCVAFTTALGFLLTYVQQPFRPFTRAIATVLVLFDLAATYYTGSRGGFLATIALLGMFVLMRQPNLIRIVTRFVWILPSIFVVFMLAPSYLTTMNDESHSAAHRVDMWAEGLDMAREHPLFGIGLGGFHQYTGSLIAHNSSVEIMGETGFIGLFLWVSLIYIIMKSLWQLSNACKDRLTVSYVRGLFLSMTGYVFSSMFVTLEYVTFYVIMGLCLGAIRVAGGPVEFTIKDGRRVFVIMIGWYILLKIFVMSF